MKGNEIEKNVAYVKKSDIMSFPIRYDHCDKKNANPNFIYGIEIMLDLVDSLPVTILPDESAPVIVVDRESVKADSLRQEIVKIQTQTMDRIDKQLEKCKFAKGYEFQYGARYCYMGNPAGRVTINYVYDGNHHIDIDGDLQLSPKVMKLFLKKMRILKKKYKWNREVRRTKEGNKSDLEIIGNV